MAVQAGRFGQGSGLGARENRAGRQEGVRHRRLLRTAAVAVLVATAAPGLAADGTWIFSNAGNSSGSWATSSNWSTDPIIPGSTAGDSVKFDTLDLTADSAVTLDGNRIVGAISFADTPTASNAWTINPGTAGSTLTLQTVTGTPTINVANTGVNFNANLVGTQGFTKTGGGAAVISANNIATFSGNVSVTAGTLSISSEAALGATLASPQAASITLDGGTLANMTNFNAASAYGAGWDVSLSANRGVTLGTNGGTIRIGYGRVVTVNSAISGAGALTHSDSGILYLTGTNTYTGQTNLAAGTTTFTTIGDTTSGGNLGKNGTIAFQTAASTLRYLGATDSTARAVAVNGVLGTFEIANASTNFTLGGAVTTSSTASRLIKTGPGMLTLSGGNDNAAGRVTLVAGTLVLGKASSGTTHSVGANGNTDFALIVNGGLAQLGGTGGDQIYVNSGVQINAGTFDMNGMSEGFDSLSGTGGFVTNNGAVLSTLTLGQNNNNGGANNTFAGVIRNGTSAVALVKTGTGTQILSGQNSYTGGTTISGGTLQLNTGGALGTGAITNNATLTVNSADSVTLPAISGSGAVNQNGAGVTTLSASTYSGATTVNAGRLVVAGALTSPITVNTNGTLAGNGTSVTTGLITLNDGSSVVGGNALITGTGVAAGSNVNILRSGTGGGTFDVIGYGTGAAPSVSSFNSSVYRGGVVADNTTTRRITLTYTADGKSWASTGGGTWDVGSSAFWTGTSDSLFYWGDSVDFGDTPNDQAVTLSGNLAPSAITVRNTANTYTINGSGSIIGTSGLTKSGAGTLTIETANSYSGQTLVNAGTLKVGNNAALGMAGVGNETVVASGATLDLNDGQAASTVILPEIIRIAGTGVGNAGAIINSGTNAQTNALGYVTLTADASIGGAARWDMRNASNGGAIGSPVLDLAGFTLTKVGTNQISLVGTTITPGNITISAGTLGLELSTTATGAGTITIASTGTLGLYGTSGAVTRGIVSNAGTISNLGSDAIISSPITINTGVTTLTGGNTSTLYGDISGAGRINKTGTGTFVLAGNNTFAGSLLISNAGIRLGSSTGLPSGVKVTLYNGNTPTFDLNGFAATVGNLGSGSAPDTGSVVQLGSGGRLTVIGNTHDTAYGGLDGQFWGIFAGSGAIEYAHATAPQGLWDWNNANSTFTGSITITSGRLRFLGVNNSADATALGNATNPLIFNGNPVATLNNGGGTASMQVTNGSAGLAVALGSGRAVTINNGKQGTFYVWGGTSFAVNGPIGGGGDLRKEDGGTLILGNAANNYTGETQIINGTLKLGANEVLPNTTIVRLGTSDGNTPTLDLNGATETIAGLSSVQTSNSTTTTNGRITGAGSLVISGTTSQTFGGQINGTASLTKSGTGTQTLSGANGYSGPTNITGGTLAFTGSGSIASSPVVTVQSGATLNATGTSGYTIPAAQTLTGSGSVTGGITANGSIAPGTGGVGTLAVTGPLAMAVTSQLLSEVSPSTASSDKINVAGAVTITSGSKLGLSVVGTDTVLPPGTVLTLIDYANPGDVTGTFQDTSSVNLPEGSTLLLGLNTFKLSYIGSYNTSSTLVPDSIVSLSVVPEPSTLALAGVAGLLMMRRRRRQA